MKNVSIKTCEFNKIWMEWFLVFSFWEIHFTNAGHVHLQCWWTRSNSLVEMQWTWDSPQINWCRISSMNSRLDFQRVFIAERGMHSTAGWCIDKKLLPESRLLALGNTWFLCRSWTLFFGVVCKSKPNSLQNRHFGSWTSLIHYNASTKIWWMFFLKPCERFIEGFMKVFCHEHGSTAVACFEFPPFSPKGGVVRPANIGSIAAEANFTEQPWSLCLFLMLAGCLFSS